MKTVEEILKPYRDTLSNSRPIFALKVNDSGVRVSLMDEFKYRPEIIPGDGLSYIFNRMFDERFDKLTRRFVTNEQSDNSYVSSICNHLKTFIRRNGPFKNAKQSKIYRFFNDRSLGRMTEIEKAGLINLYQYIFTHTGADLVFADKNSPHCKNALAILDAIQEKYGKA